MKFLVLFISLLLTSNAVAGPFGTEMGDAQEKFQGLVPIPTSKMPGKIYAVPNLPKKHSTFSTYVLSFGNNGLAGVFGVSENFTNDGYGIKIKNEYEKIKSQLTEKYGQPQIYEELNSGSIWDNDNEFVISLLKNERAHSCEWNKNLSDNVSLIRLKILAISSDTTQLAIFYKYKNYDDIEKQQNEKEKDSL